VTAKIGCSQSTALVYVAGERNALATAADAWLSGDALLSNDREGGARGALASQAAAETRAYYNQHPGLVSGHVLL